MSPTMHVFPLMEVKGGQGIRELYFDGLLSIYFVEDKTVFLSKTKHSSKFNVSYGIIILSSATD